MKKIAFACFLFFKSFVSFAGTTVDTKILYVGINTNNVIFFGVDRVVDEPGCPSDQILLPPDSNIREKIFSLALTAKASGSQIQLRTRGCYLGKPSMLVDTGGDLGWLYIK